MSTEPWVSVEDVVKHLSVAKDSVYRWIEHRGLPAHKVGRLWKFKLSDVDEWVRRQDDSVGDDDRAARIEDRSDRLPKRRGRT